MFPFWVAFLLILFWCGIRVIRCCPHQRYSTVTITIAVVMVSSLPHAPATQLESHGTAHTSAVRQYRDSLSSLVATCHNRLQESYKQRPNMPVGNQLAQRRPDTLPNSLLTFLQSIDATQAAHRASWVISDHSGPRLSASLVIQHLVSMD
jgi:hypothetical protein